jgi:ubiquinone/menaquinone biosynthesis C-methylase UbiE
MVRSPGPDQQEQKAAGISNASHDTLREFYDKRYADGYMGDDRYTRWSHSGPQLRRILETLREVPRAASAVLDYGCGQGAWTGVLATCFPRAGVYGIDISDVAIRRAQSKFPDQTFTAFDGVTAPFPDAFFEVVFSYHVLEHVAQIERTIEDICRLLRPGGHACVVFPCGNDGSFEDWAMKRMRGGIQATAEGRKVHFYEPSIGHLRRMRSDETIRLFEDRGVVLERALYSNQFVGWVEWLVRGHDRESIEGMLEVSNATGRLAKLQLLGVQKSLLLLNWITLWTSIDLRKKRTLPNAVLALVAKAGALGVERSLMRLAICEWQLCKRRHNGAEQLIVFRKP